jgi:hypothetical protein
MCCRSKIARLAIASLAILVLGGCANAFRDFGDKSSDEYLIAQTKNQLDALKFDSAIDSITPVLTSQPHNEEVVYLATAAYAGRGGLRILDLFTAIASDISTKSIFEIFAEHFKGATDDSVADIESAMNIMEAYGPTAADRSADLNFFSIFLYYSRIGVILNRYAYDSTTNTVKSNFNACYTTGDLDPATTGLPNEMVDRIMLTVPRIFDAASAVSGQGGALDTLADTAGFPSGLSSTVAVPCTTTPNDASCVLVRALVNVGPANNGIGLGSASGSADGGTCTLGLH